MTSLRNLALLLLLSFQAPAMAASDPTYFEDLQCTKRPWGLQIPTSLKGLRAIGRLKSETQANGYAPEEELRLLTYDGLKISLVAPKAKPEEFLIERVEIDSPQWRLSKWVRVGDRIDVVLKRLGRPIALKNSQLEIGGDTDSVTVEVTMNRVTRIIFHCYVG